MKRTEAEYTERIEQASTAIRALANEALEHLLALPDLDAQEALDSLQLVEMNARTMRYYMERRIVLARLRASAGK